MTSLIIFFKYIAQKKVILLLLILSAIFFYKVLQHPTQFIYPSGDILGIYYPEKLLFKETFLKTHEIPRWNQMIFGGYPFLGNPTAAMFYPLNILYVIFPVESVFGFMFMIDSFLIGVFTYYYSKQIKLSTFSSIISATSLMFSGTIISLIFAGHLMNVDTFVWFPATLLFSELILQTQKKVYIFLLGLSLALSMLSGASQVTAFSFFALTLYIFLRLFFLERKQKNIKTILKLCMFFLLSLILAVSLAAIQILPTLEFAKLSARSHGLSFSFASDFFLDPRQIISFILPYFFGSPLDLTYWGKGNFWSTCGYIGIIPILLSLTAILFKRNKYVVILGIVGLFCLLYSFGKYTPLFYIFFEYIPGFKSFRVPARFLYQYAFCASILAGFGAEYLIEKLLVKNLLPKIKKLSLVTLGISILIAFVFIILKQGDTLIFLYGKYILKNIYAVGINHNNIIRLFINDLSFFLIIVSCFCLLVLLYSLKKISLSFFKVCLVGIVFFDLFRFGQPYIKTVNISSISKLPKINKTMKNDISNYRVFDKDGAMFTSLVNANIKNITGVGSLYLADYRNYVWSVGEHDNLPYESFFSIKSISHPEILDNLNVKYVFSATELTNKSFKKVDELASPHYYVYENLHVFPRAYVKNESHNSYTSIPVEDHGPNTLSLTTSVSIPSHLILSEVWYPGWKAYDNNKEVTVEKSNKIFRSIYLKPGKHDIIFTYDPISFKIGKLISILALSFYLLYFLTVLPYDLLKKISRTK